MTEFLKTVANHYMVKSMSEARETGEPVSLPLSRYVFCFPNHRSSLFFSRYLQEAFQGPCCVPDTVTINDLFGLFSHRQVADRITLLFRLFDVYRRLSTRSDKEEFDQFVFWGDMLLSDFEDIDKYLVYAERLFSNIRDQKEIDAVFAGYDPEVVEHIQRFWKNYNPSDSPEDSKREAFSQTWSILNDLYNIFKKELAHDNLAYSGMMEREVVEDEHLSFDDLRYHKVVFVGLTAISKAERKLMSRLLVQGRAEFCWDYADPLLSDPHSPMSSAAYFTAQNLRDFPNEITDQELKSGLVPDRERNYSLYAIPSGVGQAQLARRILQYWQEHIEHFNPFRTAVVLLDENLLIPMLYAVPQELGLFNVTMGYSLKNTPVAAFVQNLANLHDNCRVNADKGYTFYYKNVFPILQHNYTTAIAAEAAKSLCQKIADNNLYQLAKEEFQDHPYLSLIFREVTTADETIAYLLDVLECIMQYSDQFTETDYEFIYHYHAAVEKIRDVVKTQNVSFTPRTLFLLLNKLVNGISVPFSGEPLQGLQVMGVLETRTLDFDNIIFLSMNEGILPAKPVSNTFVPISLRNAFEMPTHKHRDAVFAYHFYRLISRARNVALIYDSRTEGMQTGEESRYVKQLRFLLGHDELVVRPLKNDITTEQRTVIEVRKTPEMLAMMRENLGPQGNRALSASSLKNYITCPLRFYLGFVKQLQEDQEVTEGVDQRSFGDILHFALCSLYEECEGKEVDSGLLRQYIDHPEGEVTKAILAGFKEVMKNERIEGYNLLIMHILVQYVVQTLRHDASLGRFRYIAGEKKLRFLYPLDKELQIRITCVFDRLDQILTSEDPVLRVVDYKTGNSQKGGKLQTSGISQLFTSEGKGSPESFQVMLYCLMLMYAREADLNKLNLKSRPQHLAPYLYFVRDFTASTKAETRLTLGVRSQKETIEDFSVYAEEFKEHFHALIKEIFDPTKTFTQCEDDHHCKMCPFKSYCQR